MNLSMLDLPGLDALAVSNFTVFGDTKRAVGQLYRKRPNDRGRELF